MGARQSKRSVDITTTPKKEGIPAEGGVVGDAAAPGDGKLERIEETDTKPTTNGIAPHTEVSEDKDKEKDKDDATEKDKEKQDEAKPEETKQESTGESPAEAAEAAEAAEVTTPTDTNAASPNTATSPDSTQTKKKDKVKKKWSFRSISFSKKDKSKPTREETPKNGDVTKEEPLAEGGEEAENAASSPVEEKLAVSSPIAENESAPAVVASPTAAATEAVEAKEEVVATSAASSPIEEKKEEPTPSAPTPVPVEDKKEEVEKVEAEKKVVEVSPAGGQSIADPVEVSVFRVQPVATPSIIERKTSEDLPSQPPSSPPPTPIDPSPLQQAQQAAASATALAEALKLPAEAAADDKDQAASMPPTEFFSPSFDDERHSPPQPSAEGSPQIPQYDASSRDEPQTEAISSPKLETAVEYLPVVEEAAALDRVSPIDITTKEASSSIENQDKIETRTSNETETETIKTDETLPEQRDAIPQSPSLTEGSKSISETETFQTASQTVSKVILNGIPESVPVSTPRAEVLPESTENVPESASENDEKVIEDIPVVVEENISIIESKVVESIPVATEQLPDNQEVVEPSESSVEQIANVECTKDTPKENTETIEIVRTKIVEPSADLIIDSEEGPVSVSEEILVEAKPAYVIPEDEILEENTENSKADNIESVEVIVEVDEEKLENEPESDTAVPTVGTLVSYEPEDASVQEDVTIETSLPINDTIVVTDKLPESEKDIIEVSETSEIDDTVPPPPESPMLSSQQDAVDIESYPSTVETVETEPITISEAPQPEEKEPPSPKQRVKSPDESSLIDSSVIPQSPVVRSSNELVCSINEKDETSRNESQGIDVLSSRLENVSVSVSQPSDDIPPPAPLEAVECVNSSEYPLPPEELSCSYCPNNVSEIPRELPVPDEHASDLRNPTETLLTPPRSPSPRSNVSNESGVTTATNDCSQTQLHDDQSNREFKTESVSLSLNSYNDSDVELKERLAESLTETLAETANQEETLSCQLSNNNAMPTAAQENHQSTPEPEAPVENNVAHVTNTIESVEEAPKVVAPTVPVEAPASPPTAPAITEDVASVTKAIEEIDISDKAVAAAVNESIECKTNEIIADINE